jgi:hypothetical protein
MTTQQKLSALQNLKTTGNLQPIEDELNPQYLFNLTATELLVQIANGTIDAKKIASQQLQSRGLNLKGVWVGFTAHN